MLVSAEDIRGLHILATDGEIGKVQDVYFDDATWNVRFLVVDTGSWLAGKLVLISAERAGEPNWEKSLLPVALGKKEIEESPMLDEVKPVSRQHETERYYGWPASLRAAESPLPLGPFGIPVTAAADVRREAANRSVRGSGDFHLRSLNEVVGYHIQATDGEIGHVEDFLVDPATWEIRRMVVATRNWLPGRKVGVQPRWIQDVRWDERKVHVGLPREEVKESPEAEMAPVVNTYRT